MLSIRAGFHTGPVVGNLVGTVRRKYTLLGDTVRRRAAPIVDRVAHATLPAAA